MELQAWYFVSLKLHSYRWNADKFRETLPHALHLRNPRRNIHQFQDWAIYARWKFDLIRSLIPHAPLYLFNVYHLAVYPRHAKSENGPEYTEWWHAGSDRGIPDSAPTVRGCIHSRRGASPPKRNPNSFSAAGFVYTGKEQCIRTAKTNIKSVLILHYTAQYLSIFHLLTGNADETLCFPCGGGFKGWLGDVDDPWQELTKWFPNCVYVRYVMEGNEQQPDAVDNVSMKKHKCTIV